MTISKKKIFKKKLNYIAPYDKTLVWLMILTLSIGFIMITSSSLYVGEHFLYDPFYFAKRNACYLFLVFFLSFFILRIPMIFWQKQSKKLLIISVFFLVFLLNKKNSIHGIHRWISIGSLHFQPAELLKLSFFCYLASYLSRKIKKINNSFWDFLKPFIVVSILSVLLLLEPDLGTVIVILTTTFLMLYLAGSQIKQLFIVFCISIIFIIILIVTKPYRLHRILSFFNPWKDPLHYGYQLTQSLMALGRGHYWGTGLGNSIQKIFYLPEPHTDFIFSIIGEELGFFGVLIILYLLFSIIFKAFSIGFDALEKKVYFSGFLAYSIGLWLSMQVLINAGTSLGILPTKGLTLPFISYGGSSLIINAISIFLLLRIDYENFLLRSQAFIYEIIDE
ncbi:putative lipid II flippase FtsW [Candidatus Tachikawaea gelatinosa]|uniref:Probable peptidoglycan glycosyltransferase FtsW n=1 Tax=Candidatus Tachikawaea gelatinosa TaxID=1410383 RepID=A0A090BWE4_9ENTR|nr:putative lipid II flippase FtsW [Candidatus Tachikawaea gelatinosa]BAP58461.1 lipid II flippase FtsW [Candidatus Tachikawaea gelatinosa]